MKPYHQSNVYIDYDYRYTTGYSDGKKAGIEKVKADLIQIINESSKTDDFVDKLSEYLKK